MSRPVDAIEDQITRRIDQLLKELDRDREELAERRVAISPQNLTDGRAAVAATIKALNRVAAALYE